jgi:hypothetical protein
MMENNHKLTLFLAYYLARYDDLAYVNLGLGNQKETHNKIGEKMNVNPHTVKNMRDEFDPLFGNRVGWYQRPMSPSRIRIVQALENLDERQVFEIISEILSGEIREDKDAFDQLLNIVTTQDNRKKKLKFILRAPTGKAAEEFFIKHFNVNNKPAKGMLVDCREYGVGYDFRIEEGNNLCYVEVKGLSDTIGGILFTDKEWTVAKKLKDKYFLCVVSNISHEPEITFIQDPSQKLLPKRNIYTAIQVSYSITQNQLNEINDN